MARAASRAAPSGPSAESRVLRLVAVGFLPAAVVFGLLAVAPLMEQWAAYPPAWSIAALVVILAPALLLGATALVLPVRALRVLATASAAGAVLAEITEPLVARPGDLVSAPWIQSLTAVGAIAGAVAWRRPLLAALVTLVVAALTFVDRTAAGGLAAVVTASRDGLYVLLFCLTFVGLAAGVRARARAEDAAERAAASTAATVATAAAREREQSRVNALVHDRVLATLLSAAGDDPDGRELARSDARRALADLEALLAPTGEHADLTGEELVWRLQSVTTELAPEAVFGYAVLHPVAAEALGTSAVEALVGALEEALRNSLRHAAAAPNRAVHVEAGPAGVTVDVLDDGQGFDAARVPPGRLGIARSIRDRMAAVPGGGAEVVSAAGSGTRVRLRVSRRGTG